MSEAIEYKRGDKVWVEGVITYDHKLHDTAVGVTVNGSNCYPTPDQVVLIQQFFKKDDPCVYQETPCTVVWIDGSSAWIRGDDGQDWVVDASEIRRPGKKAEGTTTGSP